MGGRVAEDHQTRVLTLTTSRSVNVNAQMSEGQQKSVFLATVITTIIRTKPHVHSAALLVVLRVVIHFT